MTREEDELRQRLRSAEAQLGALEANIGRDFYEMGRIYFETRRDKVYRVDGFKSLKQWVEGRTGRSLTTVNLAISIYENYSPRIAARYGPEKLEAGVAWLRATPEEERPGDLVAAKLRLRGEAGRFVHKRFHDAKAVEVWDAVALLEEAKKGRARIPRKLRDQVAAFTEKLPPGPKGVRSDSRIRLRRDAKSGGIFVTFTGIPLSSLDAFAAVVRDLRETVTD